MDTLKFLEEITVIESKIRQKAGDKSGKSHFSTSVHKLFASGELNQQDVNDLKSLWELRNRIYVTLDEKEVITKEAQDTLANLVSNPKLQ